MEREKDSLARQKEDWKSHLFRAPTRCRWGLVGILISLVTIYSGLSSEGDASRGIFGQFGVLEGMGILFGSLAELMPKEQTTLAGILRVWAGLFAACGFGLLVIGGILAGGSPGP